MNEFYSEKEFDEILRKESGYGWSGVEYSMDLYNKKTYWNYYGYPCLKKGDGFIVFKECDYCGSDDFPQQRDDGYFYCVCCNAPI